MKTLNNLKTEFQFEYGITKKFLDAYPDSLNDYGPHVKSMKMLPLATHIVDVFGWPEVIMKSEILDFAKGEYQPADAGSRAELQDLLEKNFKKARQTLDQMSEAELDGRWAMYSGEELLMDFTKYSALRHSLSQITHHRAQLGVYYRLNDIPVPASYGPSADES